MEKETWRWSCMDPMVFAFTAVEKMMDISSILIPAANKIKRI